MRLSHTTRRTTVHLRSALALVALAGLSAACADSSSGPSQPRAMSAAQPLLSKNDGQGSFTIDPSQDMSVKLGDKDHHIEIPAGAVCMIGKTKYGSGTWDLPCTPEDKKQNISYKTWTNADGHPFIEFQPALRFAPGKVVLLYLADKKASMDDYSEIFYCPDNKNLPCVDESLTDASLSTVRDRKGNIYRRIKHFSGYNVAAGLDDAGDARWSRGTTSGRAVTTSTIASPAASAARGKRSGYMVVSGLENQDQENER